MSTFTKRLRSRFSQTGEIPVTESPRTPEGEQFAELGNGVTLCYESFGNPDGTPLLLIMGLGTQMIGWHEDFCEELAEAGDFRVIRYDNRDIGRSTKFKHVRAPSPSQIITRRFGPDQYDLGDMALDAVGLLAHLEMTPAHIVGVSMGGMIAQTVAARHPEVVRSLTSIMSTTGARTKGQPAPAMFKHLLKPPTADAEEYAERAATIFAAIGSPGFPPDLDYVRERAGVSFERGEGDIFGSGRQLGAILKSGNRTRELQKITAPTLVMHGTHDPLVRNSGGRATAKAIRGARLEMIEGMGHDLPRGAWPQIIGSVTQHARVVDEVRTVDARMADAVARVAV